MVLQRRRRLSLSVLGPLIRIAPTCGKAKLQLWKHLSRTRAGDRLQWASNEEPRILAAAIRSTQAYLDAAVTLSRDRNGFLQRGKGYGQLRQRWSKQPPQRLLVFHHYDSRTAAPKLA